MSDASTKKRTVRCIETGCVYSSIAEAEKNTSIGSSKISMVCNGKRKTAGGYHWEFVDELE